MHPPSEPDPVADPLIGKDFGPYRIESLIGKGGMGAVYLASRADGQFQRRVAIKTLAGPASPQAEQLFRRERQILASLSHPSVARLLDGGVSPNGILYLVMEYVEGLPLLAYCERNGLGLKDRLKLFLEIGEAVGYAHRNLVVHRDIKPDNILVTPEGIPKLLDFGLARVTDTLAPRSDEETRVLAFSPRYASPEQVLGKRAGTASDIYSLGVVLYEMLTGALPYDVHENSMEALVAAICHQPPVRPSARGGRNRQLRGDLDAVLFKALRKEPAARYPSVESFLNDIRAFLERRPVSARKGDLRYRLKKFLARHKLPVAAALLFFLLAAGALAGALWQMQAAERQRARAQAHARNLHALTNSVLFEVFDAVQRLTGSLEAQKLLVTKALEQMDRLGSGDSGDSTLDLDLADAWIKLGNLQGNPYEPNLGDPEGAIRTLRKALAIADRIRKQEPENLRAVRYAGKALTSLGEVLYGQEKVAESLPLTLQGCRLLEQAGSAEKGGLAMADAASCYDGLGDQYAKLGAANEQGEEQALAMYRKALALNEAMLQDPAAKSRALRGIAVLQMKLGRARYIQDPQSAMERFAQSLATLESLPAEEFGSRQNRRLWAYTRQYLALCYDWMGDSSKALQQYLQVLPVMENLASLEPENASAQYDLTVLQTRIAESYSYAGQVAQAITYYRRAIAGLEALARKDRDNDRLVEMAAALQSDLSRLLWDEGQKQEAEQLAARALPVLMEIAQRHEDNPEILMRAARALCEAEPRHLRRPQLAVRFAQRAVELLKYRDGWSLHVLSKAYRAAGDEQSAVAIARRGLSLFSNASGQTRKPLLQKLLEQDAELQGSR